jgi:hypothetical protein
MVEKMIFKIDYELKVNYLLTFITTRSRFFLF